MVRSGVDRTFFAAKLMVLCRTEHHPLFARACHIGVEFSEDTGSTSEQGRNPGEEHRKTRRIAEARRRSVTFVSRHHKRLITGNNRNCSRE